MFHWLKNLFGSHVQEGEKPGRSFKIPIGIRKEDGQIFAPGSVINHGLRVLVVQDVTISNDLKNLTLVAKDPSHSSSTIKEEIILEVNDDVTVVPTWELSEDLALKAKEISSEANHELFTELYYFYPSHIKQIARAFMLIAKFRRTIQHFLEGLEMTTTVNLGLIDYNNDPRILGLSKENPQLIYRIEDKTPHFFDTFLGQNWDVVDLTTMDSYRVILTLELKVTSGSDLCLTAHGVLCNEKPSLKNKEYREQYLIKAAEKSIMTIPEENQDNSKEDDTNRNSLLWDSFNGNIRQERLSTPIAEENSEEEAENLKKMEASTITIQASMNETTEAIEVKDVDVKQNLNTSTFSEASGSSRPQSRFSSISHSTAASKTRIQGFFQKVPGATATINENAIQCPYPSDWQFSTVPEVITNDDEVD